MIDWEKLSEEEIRELAQESMRVNKTLYNSILEDYDKGDGTDIPIIAFCGHSGCGKDTAADYFATNYYANAYPLKHSGSVSKHANPFVSSALEMDEDECYETRHPRKVFWKSFLNCLRENDPTFLCKAVVVKGDFISGIRATIEFEACRQEKIFDIAIWVQNDRVGDDPTLEYTKDQCSLIVENNTTIEEFYLNLDKLAQLAGWKLN
jgi:hypothetical protein